MTKKEYIERYVIKKNQLEELTKEQKSFEINNQSCIDRLKSDLNLTSWTFEHRYPVNIATLINETAIEENLDPRYIISTVVFDDFDDEQLAIESQSPIILSKKRLIRQNKKASKVMPITIVLIDLLTNETIASFHVQNFDIQNAFLSNGNSFYSNLSINSRIRNSETGTYTYYLSVFDPSKLI